jgi:hypothetical protein
MLARILQIEEKVNRHETDIASIDHFRTKPGPMIEAQAILTDPAVTLYCLDEGRREAVFVETPPDVDLMVQPFYFQAQYQHAQRLVTIPYETLHKLADLAGNGFQNLVFIYSVGRCGSTLLSRTLNRISTVYSLGEPDVHTQITALRPRDGTRDADLTRLLRSTTRLLYKPRIPKTTTLAVKFRAYAIEIADLLYKAFPEAKILFVYRNAETWARSYAKAFDVTGAAAKDNLKETLQRYPQFLERTNPLLLEYLRKAIRPRLGPKDFAILLALAAGRRIPLVGRYIPPPVKYLAGFVRSLPPGKLIVQQWLSVMSRYLDLNARGIPMLAVRYEGLVSAPRPALSAIFEHCGLPKGQLPVAEAAFAEDSQRGSNLARERVAAAGRTDLTEEDLAQVREALREDSAIREPDFIVPNTVMV